MGDFWITEDWLLEHGSANSGWTAKQLRAIDVPWPPAKGWAKYLIGAKITQEQRRAFEQIGAEHRARKARRTRG